MEHLKRFGAGVAVIMFVLFIYWLVYLLSELFFGYTMYAVGILAIPGAYLFGWVLRESDKAGKETAESLADMAAATLAKELNNDDRTT